MINGNACFAYFNKSWGIPIKEEIATLKDYQARVRPQTAFGDSNTEAIRVQVRTLEDALSENDIWGMWGEEERLVGVALEAFNWRMKSRLPQRAGNRF